MPPLRLVMVGGGFTGAVAIIHAIRASDRQLDITVVEPSAELGRGLAYGTRDPGHRLNVPSQRMGVFVDDPGQPTRWLFAKGILPDATSEDAHGQYYVSRHVYGTFVRDLLDTTLRAAGERVRFRHAIASAAAIERDTSGWRIDLTSGGPLAADMVALCFGHAAPAAPCPVEDEARAQPKFVADPWRQDALRPLADDDRVLIAGTGLTMVDVAASLLQRGHRGPLVAVSRRGLLPRTQGRFINDLDVLDGKPVPRTALGLLRLVRRCARRHGPTLGWHPAMDSTRAAFPILWPALPAKEKQRVARRLLPFWEVHRFRIAPQTEAIVTEALKTGQLTLVPAALVAMSHRDGRFSVTLRRPGGATEERTSDGIVLCTGPHKDPRANPLIASLFDRGLARVDDVGLGVAVDKHSRVLDSGGTAQADFLAFGPLTRGSFGEMTGAPDISRHIERIARDVFGPGLV